MKIYQGLLNCVLWYTATLVYSQVLSVPAGDGGLHVRQAPRASCAVSVIEVECRLTLPINPVLWVTHVTYVITCESRDSNVITLPVLTFRTLN